MFVRSAFVVSLLGIVGCTSAALANSCSNVDVLGTYDESGLHESEYGISAVGTFRIAGEQDESKQPMFNLASITCEKQRDEGTGRESLECKVTQAVVSAQSGNPDPNNPNCSLDLNFSTYSMKELQRGVLTGMEAGSSICYNSILTVDRNTKKVYLSFTRTKEADNADRIRPGTCAMSPPVQVLMNCTGWARIRKSKQGQAPPRYCDFSNASDR
jgi:hypothetical protein